MPDFFKPKKQILKTPEQAYSELLGGSTENQVVEIDISLIDEIDDQPQSIHQDKIDNIAESMKHIGQIDPVTVVKSKKEGRYVLLAGRHRKRACLLNGQKSVKAIIKIANASSEYKTFNLGCGYGTSIRELLKKIETTLNVEINVVYEKGRSVDVPINYLDISRYERCFGELNPISLEDGIMKTAEFLRRNIL